MPTDAGATLLAGASAGAAGAVFGLDYAVLVAGFGGGFMAVSLLDDVTPLKRFLSIVTATIAAGYLGPLFALGVTALLQVLPVVGGVVTLEAVKLPVAMMTGFLAQGTLLPEGRDIVKALMRRAGKLAGKKMDEV